MPSPREGQVLVRVRFLSLDPYMRGRMDEAKSYAPSQKLGEPMVGGTAGEVVSSRHPGFRAGDAVVGMGGWQEWFLSDGQALRKVDAGPLPLSLHLGAAGMPGITAWYGVGRIGQPRPDETVVVSAAAGAVGSVAGQLAKLRGSRVVGVAGGPAKCAHAVADLGFDACVDHRAPDLRDALRAAAPDGVDFAFENVGGEVLDAVLAHMRPFGRVALCGLVAGYQGAEIPLRAIRSLLTNRVRLQGFIVTDHLELWPEATRELVGLLASGKLRHRETVAEGIESAPRAFLGMLRGENLGKQLVRIS